MSSHSTNLVFSVKLGLCIICGKGGGEGGAGGLEKV